MGKATILSATCQKTVKSINKVKLLGLVAISLWSCGEKNGEFKTIALEYPKTKKIDHIDEYWGEQVADPYRWLEDDNAEDTKAWVIEQNKVSFGYLEQIPFRER